MTYHTTMCMDNKLFGKIVFIISLFVGTATQAKPITLTMRDAILLALRHNASFHTQELDRIVQKYALVVERYSFEPQYTLGATANYTHNTLNGAKSETKSYGISEGVSLKNKFGTKFTLSNTNPLEHGTNPKKESSFSPTLSLEVEQPLIQGFGRDVVEASLKDALDSEEINKLNFRNNAIALVDEVFTNYLNLYQSQENLLVDKGTLKSYKDTLKSDMEKFRSGRLPRNDLVQDRANVASELATIQNDRNSVQQSRHTLLKTLGLDPHADIKLPSKIYFSKLIRRLLGGKKLPLLKTSQKLALHNNINYQVDGISLKITKRALMTAKDSLRWQLNLDASEKIGGTDGGYNAFHNNHVESVGLNLNIPINDIPAKSGYLSAKIALKNAEILYKEEKRSLEISIQDDRTSVLSGATSLKLAKEAFKLQKETVNIATLKNKAGLLSTFELNQQQQNLKSQEQSLISSIITYLSYIQTFNEKLGRTLDVWNIHIKE